ncbi:hypothetical protein HY441_01500 [Candidatus Microgenomates bacterium]|nr:hypothetical protein [Candidatus Microgenomates bacterium]
MKKLFNQRGAVPVLVLVVAIVVALAAVSGGVYYALQSRKKAAETTKQEAAAKAKADEENKVKDVAKQHFTQVWQGRTSDAWYDTCEGFKEGTSLSDFEIAYENDDLFETDLSQVNYTSVNIANDQAHLIGDIGPVKPGETIEVDLLKEDGEWCVWGYEQKG